MGQADEIASAIAFLASDGASFTGAALVVDSGLCTHGLPRSQAKPDLAPPSTTLTLSPEGGNQYPIPSPPGRARK
jgi:hypothetical protein